MIPRLGRFVRFVGALSGLLWTVSRCGHGPAGDGSRPGWSFLVAVPDTVLLDTVRVEWVSADARVWLRSAAVESRHEVSCERREIRDLVVRDSAAGAAVWIPASAHPALRDVLPALCARLSQLNPRGLHNLLGSDRP